MNFPLKLIRAGIPLWLMSCLGWIAATTYATGWVRWIWAANAVICLAWAAAHTYMPEPLVVEKDEG